MLRPVTIEGFGGLNLRDDPQEVGPESAIDMSNVEIDRQGRVRTRDGIVSYATTAAGTIANIGASGGYLFTYRGGNLDVIDNLGTVTALGVGDIGSFAHLGTPTATYFFFRGVATPMKRWNLTTYVNSVGTPRFIAVSPWDNRLAQASYGTAASSPTGANGSRSTVFFSDAGAPETYGANNYIHLQPGDGEDIEGMVSHENFLYVFKASNMFVFYGTSTSATGTPVFNYRRVSLPSSLRPSTSNDYHIAAGPYGVYFVAYDGIYRTTGGPPTRISDAIEGIFSPNETGSTLSAVDGHIELGVGGKRLFARYNPPVAGNALNTLVYDEDTGQWSMWHLPQGKDAVPVGWAGDTSAPYSYYTAGSNTVYKFTSGTATDDGAAMAARYQSGWYDLGTPDRKVIRESMLWGSGSPTLSVFGDHGSTDSLASAVTLGTSPDVAAGRQRIARRARLFSHKVSSTSGAWVVNRVTHYLRDGSSATT